MGGELWVGWAGVLGWAGLGWGTGLGYWAGLGCWGGSFQASLDFLIGAGQVMPLNINYPYAGVQGQCDR